MVSDGTLGSNWNTVDLRELSASPYVIVFSESGKVIATKRVVKVE